MVIMTVIMPIEELFIVYTMQRLGAYVSSSTAYSAVASSTLMLLLLRLTRVVTMCGPATKIISAKLDHPRRWYDLLLDLIQSAAYIQMTTAHFAVRCTSVENSGEVRLVPKAVAR